LRDARPDLPSAFIRVVERATAEQPTERYQSAGELEAALNDALGAKHDGNWKKLLLLAAMILAVALAAMTVPRIMQRSATPSDSRTVVNPGVAAAKLDVPSAGAATATNPYRIESAFYRESNGVVERLKAGATLAAGDALSLQVQTSIPMYFYVVNEDERGESYLLFPLPGQELQNPLPPGQRHRLPAMQSGELISWQVSSTGLREHFMIVASPERSTSFDELFATLPQPVFGRPPQNARLSSEAIGVLRSVGGLIASPAKIDRQLRLMPEFSTPLTEGEEPGQGVWIRQATFMNPGK
jgi:hypothetical protein